MEQISGQQQLILMAEISSGHQIWPWPLCSETLSLDPAAFQTPLVSASQKLWLSVHSRYVARWWWVLSFFFIEMPSCDMDTVIINRRKVNTTLTDTGISIYEQEGLDESFVTHYYPATYLLVLWHHSHRGLCNLTCLWRKAPTAEFPPSVPFLWLAVDWLRSRA